jgi:phage FluMu protein Com
MDYIRCKYCNFLLKLVETQGKSYCSDCKEWTYIERAEESLRQMKLKFLSKK